MNDLIDAITAEIKWLRRFHSDCAKHKVRRMPNLLPEIAARAEILQIALADHKERDRRLGIKEAA